MVTISKTAAFVLVSAVAFGQVPSSALADGSATQVFKSAQGVMLDVGSKKVAGYYLAGDQVCNLTLMIANRPDADGNVTGAATRMNVPVKTGTKARIYTGEGNALEAGCSLKANVMSLRTLDQTAAAVR